MVLTMTLALPPLIHLFIYLVVKIDNQIYQRKNLILFVYGADNDTCTSTSSTSTAKRGWPGAASGGNTTSRATALTPPFSTHQLPSTACRCRACGGGGLVVVAPPGPPCRCRAGGGGARNPNPKPQTSNPKHQTPNSEPETRNSMRAGQVLQHVPLQQQCESSGGRAR